MADSLDILKRIYAALDDKKGEKIKIIDVSHVTVMTDYFVITNGNSNSQIDALVDSVTECLTDLNIKNVNVEGGKNTGWTLIDAGNIIIHIFSKENREFYNLERIWNDGKIVEF